MKICFFNLTETSDAKVANGVVRVAMILACALRSRGNEVVFYTPPPKRDLKQFGLSAGAHFRKFLREREIEIAVWHMGNCRIPFSLKKLPCPLICVWHNAPNYKMETYPERLAEKYGVRSGIFRKLFLSRASRFLIRRAYEIYRERAFFYACRQCRKFVLLSEKFFPEFPPMKKFSEKVCAVPNPAAFPPVENIDFSKKKKELLFVGRLEFGQKRPDLLLEIWARLESRFSDWSLRIVGDGPDAERIRALAGTLGLQRVRFEGFRDPKPFYRDAAIFCMTSEFEGFPMVLVEAAAFGCVPVAFDSFAAVSDIIAHGENGVLVPAFDCAAYAEEIARLMTDAELRERLALAARDHVFVFAPDKIAARWETLFAEAMRSRAVASL